MLFNKKLLVKSQELSERGSRDGPGREGLLSSPEDTAWWEITFARCHSATQPQQGPGTDVEVEKAPSWTDQGIRIRAEAAERQGRTEGCCKRG